MNLDAELKLPVLTRGGTRQTLGDIIEGPAAAPYSSFTERHATDAKQRLHAAERALKQYGTKETKQLGIERAKAEPEAIYRLLNGKTYTAAEVVKQIRAGTRVGRYFALIHKQAAIIATQKAAAKLFPLT